MFSCDGSDAYWSWEYSVCCLNMSLILHGRCYVVRVHEPAFQGEGALCFSLFWNLFPPSLFRQRTSRPSYCVPWISMYGHGGFLKFLNPFFPLMACIQNGLNRPHDMFRSGKYNCSRRVRPAIRVGACLRTAGPRSFYHGGIFLGTLICAVNVKLINIRLVNIR